ncbi:MAG TPA: sensor histidine kinase, partial [Methylomirabilota bacterium]|nr:sensor histidine kinase [Methylomirabilota bacterium]
VTWSNAVLRGADGRVEHVIGTGIDITEHRRLEREIIEISEREQRRIGQDLHDGVCQQLAGIEFMSQVLAQTLSGRGRPAAPAENAATIARLVREAIEQIRGVARGLSPVVLESEGLMSALTELAERIRHVFRIECAFECPRPVPVPDNHVATHLYRIAQEAVNNALRHGKATRIELRLARSGGRIVLGIHDNGVGLPAPLPSHRGMGLRIMQYRAGIIGGSLALERRPGGGTSVVCSLRAGAG